MALFKFCWTGPTGKVEDEIEIEVEDAEAQDYWEDVMDFLEELGWTEGSEAETPVE